MLSFSVLRHRNFRLLMFSRAGLIFALQAQAVIVGWQIYSLTKDPFLLGLTGLAEALPALLCSLFSGHVVDNGRPRRVYAACAGALFLNTLALTLLAGEWLPVPHAFLIPALFAGVFLSGIARSFVMPAAFALLSGYVSRREMPAAAAWMNSVFQASCVCGPAMAGLLYGGYGAGGAWLLPVFALGVSAVLALRFSDISPSRKEKRESAVSSIAAGWRFIFAHPVLLPVMALDMFAVLLGGAVAMLPAFADHVLGVGAEGLGALRAAPALGSVVTALFFALRPMRHLTGLRLLGAFAGFGLSMIGFGLSQSFALSMLFLALSGAFDSINVIIRSTLIQLLTPADMRGRVSAVNTMFIISSNEIGAFESGLTARLIGLVPSVVFGGIAALGVVGATGLCAPGFRKTVLDTSKQDD